MSSNKFAFSIYSLPKLDCSSKLSSGILREVATFFLMEVVNAVNFHLLSLILPDLCNPLTLIGDIPATVKCVFTPSFLS